MIEFFQRYFQYRRVGFGRFSALRFALLVASRSGGISAP
jgi:hypothetical protein